MLDNVKTTIKGFFNSKKDAPKEEEIERVENIKEELFQEEIISFVKEELEKRAQDRLPFELQWQLNMNFLQGNQYCDINLALGEIQEYEKVYFWQQREVYNHIAPIVETRKAKLSRIKPILATRPATPDLDDVSTAKVCTSIVNGNYNRLEMSKKIQEATSWSEVCGTVFYKSVWDPNIGRAIGQLGDETVYEGDIITTVVSPYEIFPDSNYAASLDECRSVIHAKAYHVDEIEEIWGVKVEGREVDVFSISGSNIGLGGLGYSASIPKVTKITKEKHELIIEYYEKPTKQYPEGRLIIIAGDKLLHYGDLPYMIGENNKRDFPLTRQVCVVRDGCFWGTSVIERCIPIQRSYNAVKNRKHEFMNRIAFGVLDIEEDAYDTEDLEEDGLYPGKVLLRKQGMQPAKYLDTPNVPFDFTAEEDRLKEEFILVSGISEISRYSQAPTSAGSGIALQILTEQDDTRLSLSAEHIRFSIIDIGKKWLRLYKQFAVGSRIVRVVGEKGDVLVSKWNASHITSDDVVIETENELASSPAQQKQMVLDLLQLGLFNDPETGQLSKSMRSKILEALEFGTWDTVGDIDEMHINRAQRENNEFLEGILPTIRKNDDDDIHIHEHERFQLTGDFERLITVDPQYAMAMEQHVEMHKQAKDLKFQVEMQKQQLMQHGIYPD